MQNPHELQPNCDSETGTCAHNGECCGRNKTDHVTREQGGQFIDEGGMLFARNLEEAALDGAGDAQLQDRDYSSVNALNVNLERSGADYIHAQKSFLTNSGARQIQSETSKLTNSGVLTLNAETAEFKNSSAVIANTRTLNAQESALVFTNAESATFTGNADVIALQANSVQAQGDIKAFALIGGEIKAGGDVSVTLNSASAAALGAGFALVLLVLGKLFGKK